jgi:pyruvate formate lyase activating enzyme
MPTESAVAEAIRMDLRGMLPGSLNEWGGRVTLVVFTAGCNWRCPYCHGRAFVEAPGSLERIPVESVFAALDERAGWIDGVAVSGGEPTLQPGLPAFLRAVRTRGLQTKLETNGTHPEVIDGLLSEGLLDCLCLDYKAPLDDRLESVTRVVTAATNAEGVRSSFALAAASGLEREYHTTLCPAFIDEAILKAMAETLETGGTWYLQQYETEDVLDPQAAGAHRFDAEELERLAAVARRHHPNVVLRSGRTAL